jgi:hypothetical protein
MGSVTSLKAYLFAALPALADGHPMSQPLRVALNAGIDESEIIGRYTSPIFREAG